MNELVYLKNDEAVCDSLQVAEKFGKEHKNVLQSIDNLIAENSAVKIMFKISSYKSGNGQSYRKFYMNRDGFSLLAMGFTGREALEWKLQYIRAFNQMENFIVKNLLRCGLKPGRQESLPERQRRIQSRNLWSTQRGREAVMQKCFI